LFSQKQFGKFFQIKPLKVLMMAPAQSMVKIESVNEKRYPRHKNFRYKIKKPGRSGLPGAAPRSGGILSRQRQYGVDIININKKYSECNFFYTFVKKITMLRNWEPKFGSLIFRGV
jgi:hypothetical protein